MTNIGVFDSGLGGLTVLRELSKNIRLIIFTWVIIKMFPMETGQTKKLSNFLKIL